MVDVDAWFHQRTFPATCGDRDAVRAEKNRTGDSVAVVLPARNEAATIRPIVETIKALADDEIVDRIIVVDGASTDDTAVLATAAGAEVHHVNDLCSHVGPPDGKGDALWRSLHVTNEDLIVFVDTDVTAFNERVVLNLLWPLLTVPQVQLVKAFYDRPIQLDGTLHSSGGGRVTELTARPLLHHFWPELSGIIQPLSGEYAGRRPHLTSLPFFTRYGVEIGMLIDTVTWTGLDSIAQVDTVERIHRNQTIDALSRMANEITTVVLHRAEQHHRITRAAPADTATARPYTQFIRSNSQVSTNTRLPALLHERPPLQNTDQD